MPPISVAAASRCLGDSGSGGCDFPAIFNFGDSNSDTGGQSAAFGSAPRLNGMTYFRSPAGRYSDSLLVIDFIAERFGLPHLSEYLDSMGSNFSQGTNFATSGSTILTPNITGNSLITLGIQLVKFLEFHEGSRLIHSYGGMFKMLLPKDAYFSHSLYMVNIRQNDLTASLKPNLTTIKQVEATFPQQITQFSELIKSEYPKGGRSFWVHSAGPPHRLPGLHASQLGFDEHGCSSGINELSQNYDTSLKEAVEGLKKDHLKASITYVDVYSVKYFPITEANKYRFKQPFLACCGCDAKYNYDNSRRRGAKTMVR